MEDQDYLYIFRFVFTIVLFFAGLWFLFDRQAAKQARDQAESEARSRKASEDGTRQAELDAQSAFGDVARRAREEFYAREGGPPGHLHDEWHDYVNRPVPPDVQRSMRSFLSGEFAGEDRSPLAYVGYRVGKSGGLPEWDRRRRLGVCFRIAIPDELSAKYSSWGPAASVTRLQAIIGHVEMLADMRRYRRNYEVAVSDWDDDAAWMRKEFMQTARKFSGLAVQGRDGERS
jgi:hypothetical protein